MTAATAVSRREILKERTRQEILGHALTEVTATGHTCLRSIARRMGMTAPALYRYFRSAAALNQAVAADVLARAQDTVWCWSDYQRWAATNPGRYAFLARPAHTALMARLHARAEQGGAA